MRMKRLLAAAITIAVLLTATACQSAAPVPEAPSQPVDSEAKFVNDMELLLSSPEATLQALLPAEAAKQLAERKYTSIAIQRTLDEEPAYTAVVEYSMEGSREDVVKRLTEEYEGEKAATAAWSSQSSIFKTKTGYVEVAQADKSHRARVRVNITLEHTDALQTAFNGLFALAKLPEPELVAEESDDDKNSEKAADKKDADKKSQGLRKTADNLRYDVATNLISFGSVYEGTPEEAEQATFSQLGSPKKDGEDYRSAITDQGLATLTTYAAGDTVTFEVALKKSCWLSADEVKSSNLTYEFYKNPQPAFESGIDQRIQNVLPLTAAAWTVSEASQPERRIHSASITFANTGTDYAGWAAKLSEHLQADVEMTQTGVYTAATKYGWAYLDVRKAPEAATLGFNRPVQEKEQVFEGFTRMPSAAFTDLPDALTGLAPADKSVSFEKAKRSLVWSSSFTGLDAASYQAAAEFFAQQLGGFESFTVTDPERDAQKAAKEAEEAEKNAAKDGKKDSKAQKEEEAEAEPEAESITYGSEGVTFTATRSSVFINVALLPDQNGGFTCKVYNTLYLY